MEIWSTPKLNSESGIAELFPSSAEPEMYDRNRGKTEIHFKRKLCIRLGEKLRNERFLRLRIKSCAFIEVMRGPIFPASH